MIRAIIYLAASGVIWLVEGFLFSRYLGFSPVQTVLMAAIYVALLALAVRQVVIFAGRQAENGLPHWRYLSLAPAVTLILGSFASLPLLLAIFIVGRL